MKRIGLAAELCAFYLLSYRCVIVAVVFLLMMVSHALNGQWGGDFWDHSAAVRELATHPLFPKHCQLALDTPHPWYSPYMLAVALTSRVSGLDSIAALSVFGILNFVFLYVSLALLVSLLFPKHAEAAAFYLFLFVPLLWGKQVWSYSGFLHLSVLGRVLPYPATFAAALALAGMAMQLQMVRTGAKAWGIPILAASIVVLLAHPLSYVLLATALVSITLQTNRRWAAYVALLLGLFTLTVLAAVVWPYYPFVKLVLGESGAYHADHGCMYQGVLKRVWPALLGVPCLILRMRADGRHPLPLMFGLLGLVYVYGAVSGQWAYGRVISYVVLVLHIALAGFIGEAESRVRWRNASPLFLKLAYALAVTIAVLILSFENQVRPVLVRITPGLPNTYEQFRFLSAHVGQYQVVLTDRQSAVLVPTFGGKIVAGDRPTPFVADHAQRCRDVERFFGVSTGEQERIEIIQKHKVSFILVSKLWVPTWPYLVRSLHPIARVLHEDNQFVLLSLRT
ncbi:MAG: hypothetical protein FJ272_05505 [Planctomycetes bacterium]|nr:hypothetical protein [Planctomycetota bacterium]